MYIKDISRLFHVRSSSRVTPRACSYGRLTVPITLLPPPTYRSGSVLSSSNTQHRLRTEASARNLSRAEQVLNRGEGASRVLDDEEKTRDEARREDQMAGPWGVDTEEVTAGEGDGEGRESGGDGFFRRSKGGTTDGLGIFGVSMEDGNFHGLCKGGKQAGVDDAEVQLFQPLQHTAHEDR